MNIRELHYFSRLCEDGKFSKAADNLYISQQGLSKAIKRLEDELQVPLFRRTPFGVEKTKFGDLINKHVEKILLEYYALIRKIEETRKQQSCMMITLELGILAIMTMSPFKRFMDIYPNIDFALQEHTEATCVRLIMREEADLGFAISPIDSKKFDYIPFSQVQGMILVNKNNPLSQKSEILLEDLRHQKLVFSGSATWYAYVRACRLAGFEPSIALSSIEQNTSYAYSIVQDNLGVCPSFYGFSDVANYPDIMKIPFQGDLSWNTCIITKKGKSLSSSTKIFIDHFMNFVSKENI